MALGFIELAKRLRKIIDNYGIEAQSIVCIEEFAEVSQATTKVLRKGLTPETKEHLTEEIADAIICLYQLKIMYNIDDKKIDEYIEQKIARTEERMEA